MKQNQTTPQTDENEVSTETDEIVLDFSAVPDSDLLPEGEYQAEIVSAIPGKSKQGHPKMDLRWRIIMSEFASRQVMQNISFHPNALVMAKQTMKALGFDVTGKITLSPSDWIGLPATIKVEVERGTHVDPSTGEPYPPRNRVKRVKKAVGDINDLM